MLRVVVATGALGLAACGAAMLPVPGKGGPAWIELTSAHFTLWTDADEARAHELVREMEHLRLVVGGVAFPSAPATGRSLVIALRDDDELRAYWPTGEARPYAVPAGAPLWQPTIVMSAFSNDDPADLAVTHELTHVISYTVIRYMPRWFAEGMAMFFETVRLYPDSTMVDVGAAPQHGWRRARLPHLVRISTLFAWNTMSTAEAERSLYSTAWALYTFLNTRYRAELLHYMQLLADIRHSASEPWSTQAERAWTQAFPSLSPDELDAELRQWLINGSHLVMHFNVKLRDWPAAQRTLGDADVYALRGFLFGARGQDAQRREDLAAALAVEPTNLLARLLTYDIDESSRKASMGRAVAAAHGEDWRAWWYAWLTISAEDGDTAEARAAAAKACALIAENPAVVAPPKLCGPTDQ